MPHARAQMRTALSTALSGLVTPNQVIIERSRRLAVDDLPVVIVHLGDEQIEDAGQSMGQPRRLETRQTITIEIHEDGISAEAVADTIDQIDLEVEAALADDEFLGGILEILTPIGSSIDMSVDQDRVLGVRSLEYVAIWRHPFGQPDSPEG